MGDVELHEFVGDYAEHERQGVCYLGELQFFLCFLPGGEHHGIGAICIYLIDYHSDPILNKLIIYQVDFLCGVVQRRLGPQLSLTLLDRKLIGADQILRVYQMEMQMVDRSTCPYRIVSNPTLMRNYLMLGITLKIFSRSNMISVPTTCGSSSSGYMDNKES